LAVIDPRCQKGQTDPASAATGQLGPLARVPVVIVPLCPVVLSDPASAAIGQPDRAVLGLAVIDPRCQKGQTDPVSAAIGQLGPIARVPEVIVPLCQDDLIDPASAATGRLDPIARSSVTDQAGQSARIDLAARTAPVRAEVARGIAPHVPATGAGASGPTSGGVIVFIAATALGSTAAGTATGATVGTHR
jgi:hypothetical protein